ncbi:MAG TPA: gamma-glutamyltransferase, partial [Flavitalea sp.]|nr:gamma-glutamyltransferase [Flavitalea sp.]
MSDRRSFIKQMSGLGLVAGLPNGLSARSAEDPELSWYASGNGGIVASGPKPSAQAGIDILNAGGNAVDASAAVIFNLMVSDYGNFCIGGETPYMYYYAKTGKVSVYNGMGGAPKDKKAIDWYYRNGIPNKKGIKASTTPSAVSTCLKALELQGT